MRELRIIMALMLAALGLPAGAGEPIWDGNRVNMVAEALAPGVVALYADHARALNASGGAAATSSGVIVGKRGALVVDTLLNKRLNAQVLTHARRLSSLPVLYAVNTSAHGDHSFGNMYLPATTRVIQHANTRSYIARHIEDDKRFMVKYFGSGRGIEEIKARAADILVPPGGRVTIDLGEREVEVIDFGFAQTGGDLFVWVPDAKVLWAGNPIIAGKPTLPWLLDGHLIDTLATLRRVYDFLPSDARIVPGHGVAMAREDLRWHIDYLAAVKDRVQAAIDRGLDLGQTVKEVAMPEYRGYVLFDWVHSGLNVPAAFKDLAPAK